MKLEFNENEFGIDLTLLPETVEDFAQLLRYTQNAAAVKPEVSMSFARQPYCYIYLKKKNPSVQKNSLKP